MVDWSQLTAGYDLPELKKDPVNEMQLVRYAGASGDFNPLHTVHSFGVMAGYDGVIAHGMLIMGFAGQAATTWFPRSSLVRFKARFAAVTKPGEEITVKGRVSQVQDNRVLVELTCVGDKGDVKLQGQLEVVGPQG